MRNPHQVNCAGGGGARTPSMTNVKNLVCAINHCSQHNKTVFVEARDLLAQGCAEQPQLKQCTPLQSMMNAKLSQQRFRHCYENGLIKIIEKIPHSLCVSVKLACLYCGLMTYDFASQIIEFVIIICIKQGNSIILYKY